MRARSKHLICDVPGAVSVKVILCFTFRLMAGDTYLDVSWPYLISSSTVYYIFHETLLLLNKVDVLWNIGFPIADDG